MLAEDTLGSSAKYAKSMLIEGIFTFTSSYYPRAGTLNQEECEKIEKCMLNPVSMGIPIYLLNRKYDYETGEN